MKLPVFGRSGFVGRPALVEDGLRRGWTVKTFNRHATGVDGRVECLRGDRLRSRDFEAFNARTWDFVVDTWSGAPRAAGDSAAALADRAGRYLDVSSCSGYAPPPLPGGDESAKTVDAALDAEVGEYASLKRGSELAIEAAFGGWALFARAGSTQRTRQRLREPDGDQLARRRRSRRSPRWRSASRSGGV